MRELRLALVGWLCVFVGSTTLFAVEPELLKIEQAPGAIDSPRAVVAADFDGDGTVEAVAGFAASEGSEGLLVHGLSPDTATPASEPSTFQASVQPTGMALPSRDVDLVPDFLWAQDFDRNGSSDLLIASRERSVLKWFEPRPGGGFIERAALPLPGSVTAGWFGELGGRNFRVQGALGVVTETGPALVMVESLSRLLAFPLDSIPLPAPAEAIFVADVDGDFLPEWIVQAGGSVYAVSWEELAPELAATRFGLRRPLRTEIRQIELAFGVRSMAVGDFRSGGADELAFVSVDDRLILTDGSGRLLCSQEIASPQAALVSGELLLLEPLKSEVTHLRVASAQGDGACFETVSRVSGLESPVLAAAARNARGDGLHLGWLRAGFSDPRWLDLPEPGFVVNSVDDHVDGACDPSHCSLREAILAAEARPGRDVIRFELDDDGLRSIGLERPLPAMHDAVWLYGASPAGESRIVLDGSQTGPDAVGLHLLADSNVIRGLTVRGFSGAALRVESSHNEIRDNVFENNGVGVVLTLGAAQQVRHNEIRGQRTHGIVLGSQSLGSSLHPNRFVGNGGLDVHVQDSESEEDLGVSLVSVAPASEGWLLVEARLRGAAGQRYDVAFYQSGSCEATGLGRGERYSATRTVWLSESGEGLLRTLVPGSIESGQALSAILVDAQGRTTTFSPCRAADLEVFRGSLDRLENGFGSGCQVSRPVARDDFITTKQAESVTFSPLANDSGDTREQNLRIRSDPLHGTAERVGPDAILYDPFDPFFGQDRMSYLLKGCLQCGSFGCTEPDFDSATIFIDVEPVFRALTVSKAGTGKGRVTSSPSGIRCDSTCEQKQGDFPFANDVELTASPSSDSELVGWSQDCSSCGGALSCIINMDADKTCGAEFRLIRRRLEVRKQGAGSGRVSSSPSGIDCGSDCVQRYTHGTEVALTPSAASRSNFLGWSGDCSGGGAAQVVMTSDRICVASFNAFPTAVDEPNESTKEDEPVTIGVLTNDEDDDGDLLRVLSASGAMNGSLMESDSSVKYTPYPNFAGTDSFTYVVGDGHGGTDEGVVTVTVEPVNDVPVAAPDSVTTEEDSSKTFDVRSNDSDVETARDALRVRIVSQPLSSSGRAVVLSDQRVRFTPVEDFHGTDSFTYEVSDGEGGSDTATVGVTVTPVNDAPVALCRNVTTAADAACQAAVSPAQIDAGSSDVDGDALTLDLTPSDPFALGATPVSLNVSDGSLTTSCSAVVEVVDQTSPAIQCPADVVQVTPDPNGDVVTFAAPAVADNCDAVPTVTCDPASGDVFSLGSQEVVCAVADASGNSSGCTFQVTLRSPTDQQDVMEDIIRELVDLGILTRGQGNALLKKLENSLKSFERGQTKASCNQLKAFENQIEDFLVEGILSPEDGNRILLELQLLRDGLGCSG